MSINCRLSLKTMCVLHLVLLCCFFTSVTPKDVEYACLAVREAMLTVVCKINKTATASAGCISMQNNVTFDLTLTETVTKCVGPPLPPNAVCEKKNNPNPNTCWCDESDGEIFTYKYLYKVDKSQDLGALLKCKYCAKAPQYKKAEALDGCNVTDIDTEPSLTHRICGRLPLLVALFLTGMLIVTLL